MSFLGLGHIFGESPLKGYHYCEACAARARQNAAMNDLERQISLERMMAMRNCVKPAPEFDVDAQKRFALGDDDAQ